MDQLTKYCKQCEQTYPLTEGFYKAGGNAYQSLCIKCHNRNRYTKKAIGYMKLPEDKRMNIEKDIHDKVSYKKIASKYEINYQTLIIWKNKNLIPPYKIE